MSIKVFERLRKMMIETTHEQRVEIDREIEARTGKYCDEVVDELSDTEFIGIINKVKRKKRKEKQEENTEEEKQKEKRKIEIAYV